MTYATFEPHPDLNALVKCYWTLEVPAQPDIPRQRIIPDGCIEMIFTLGDDIKRFTTGDEFILQPRAMVIGQTTEPFYIQPVGYVNTFGVRFYPYGFANFVTIPIKDLANRETPLDILFGEDAAHNLTAKINKAVNVQERISIIENFLRDRLTEQSTIDTLVKSTIDAMIAAGGDVAIGSLLKDDQSKRRQLERSFQKAVGISPKQLGKVIRLQTALNILLNEEPETLTRLAYDTAYYDQAHFIKDFREFTGTTPRDFLADEQMTLSTIFYKKP